MAIETRRIMVPPGTRALASTAPGAEGLFPSERRNAGQPRPGTAEVVRLKGLKRVAGSPAQRKEKTARLDDLSRWHRDGSGRIVIGGAVQAGAPAAVWVRYQAIVRWSPSSNDTVGSYPRIRRALPMSACESRTSPARVSA